MGAPLYVKGDEASPSCAETGGQGSLNMRHSYTVTADCTSTPSLPSGRL